MAQKEKRDLCTALNLSDESKCHAEATSSDGLFCSFHARQCYGLYRGYKIRNAKLDALDSSPPPYLADSKISLRNETFAAIGVENAGILDELHKYLFQKHALLERVIRARKLHHSRFYSLNLDYGHKAYLDKLTNEKFVVLRALERLERRTAEVLYKQRKWFKWVRERQNEEESARVKESEMIKKEAKLFKRHWKQTQSRLATKKQAEEAKRQEAFLDEAFQERLRQRADETDGDEDWDPIEDEVEDDRASFVDLMKALLWLSQSPEPINNLVNPNADAIPAASATPSPSANGKENVDPGKALSKNARKRAKAKAKATQPPNDEIDEENETVKIEVNESREDMHKRLVNGVRYNPQGSFVAGTIEAPHQTVGKIPGIPEEEAAKILDEVSEIKLLLFCRMLLSQAAILPAALKADSVEAFLADPEVSTSDLRDLCLRIEQPSLQEIRDACADFFRGSDDEPHFENVDDLSEDDEDEDTKGQVQLRRRHMPATWRSKKEQSVDAEQDALRAFRAVVDTAVDFGVSESNGQFKPTKIRVEVCGKTIWNYPSDHAMARGGWLHYSIIAKGSRLADAIELCRNWTEFWELNVLALYRYFPSPHWEEWPGDILRRQLLSIGFITYARFDQAQEMSATRSAGGRGQGPRVHAAFEFKNIIAGHIKRNDPVSRRFVQYLAMQTGTVVILVRDGKTGKLLVTPPEECAWIERHKAGTGRAAKTEWTITKSVGEDMFEQISGKKVREWQFGFTDFYDVLVWDLEPGKPFANVYSTVQECKIKAQRCCEGIDIYEPMAPILKTLMQEQETGRTRDVREGEVSIWDVLEHEETKVFFHDNPRGNDSERRVRFKEDMPPGWLYTDIDAAEDLVLFPDEAGARGSTKVTDRTDVITRKLERMGPNLKRFVYDMSSNEDEDDYEDLRVEGSDPKHIASGDEVDTLDGLWNDESDGEDDILFDTMDGDPETMAIAVGFETLPPPTWGQDPEKDFWTHMDREKGKIFRLAWHNAVIDPEERARYSNISTLVGNWATPLSKADTHFGLKILLWLRVHIHEHRLVTMDIQRAVAAMSLYFKPVSPITTTASTMEKLRAEINDNSTRAKGTPYTRPFNSNLTVASNFWREAEAVYEEERTARQRREQSYQRGWDATIRPIVAHWFKAGVIAPAHLSSTPGVCTIQSAPSGQPELYIDYRANRMDWPSRPGSFTHITDPYKVNLLRSAQEWQKSNPDARFALLRVWSHSHFYPLMLGHDNRTFTSFEDELQRSWEWKFVPRDMPGSEWSIQNTVDVEISPYRTQFGKQVVTKRDMLLVMGKDEEEVKRYATGVTFAVQTKPWRLEIDLWKSFVNVDLTFLEGLNNVWLE